MTCYVAAAYKVETPPRTTTGEGIMDNLLTGILSFLLGALLIICLMWLDLESGDVVYGDTTYICTKVRNELQEQKE